MSRNRNTTLLTPNMFRSLLLSFLLLLAWFAASAQVNRPMGAPQKNLFDRGVDSLNKDSLNLGWRDEQARIFYTLPGSSLKRLPDTTINRIHRFQNTQPWWGRHLGNYGTAATDLLFRPNKSIGPQLGYDIYDLYRLSLDSLRFYNTTRPYSAFSFLLGSKEEQHAEILHTQNITPHWNFSGKLRYLSSEGFFPLQKSSSISGSFNTAYESEDQRYQMKAAFVYNRFKQEESGGIKSDTFLSLPNYQDRRRIPVHIEGAGSLNRSPVSNVLRDATFYMQNNYSWGKADTSYNEDSTAAIYNFTPRFRLQHELTLIGEKHIYKDLAPDSIRYGQLAPLQFGYNDSVAGIQSWTSFDNKFSLNGFVGKGNRLSHLKVGMANRIDRFYQNYLLGSDASTFVSNYVFGELKKEALEKGEWSYKAKGEFFFSGPVVGSFGLAASLGKDFGPWGAFSIGLGQNLSSVPFAVQQFKTNFYQRSFSFDRSSNTHLWAQLTNSQHKAEIAFHNFLVANYIYLNEGLNFEQANNPFYVSQLSGRKQFSYRIFALDNELVWQQATPQAPVNLPSLMLREQLRLQTFVFKNALQIAAGIEARYLSPYFVNGYTPYLNSFYLQNAYRAKNAPELMVFFNFKVKGFRAYVVLDQLQQLFTENNIYATAWYPGPDMLFRFGFNWVLIN